MKSRLFLLLILLSMSTGCAFAGIGAGIGSAFPKTEAVAHAPENDTPVDVRNEDNGEILVRRHEEILRVGKEHVAEVRKRRGSYWVEGFLIGGAIDLVLSGVLAYCAVQSFGAGLSAMGGM
jgi:hypothetical protein